MNLFQILMKFVVHRVLFQITIQRTQNIMLPVVNFFFVNFSIITGKITKQYAMFLKPFSVIGI